MNTKDTPEGAAAEEDPQAEQAQQAQQAQQSLRKPQGAQALFPYALKQGLLLGLLYMGVLTIVYVIGPRAMLYWSFHLGHVFALVFSFLFVIFTGRRFRKAQGDVLSLGAAWRYSYVVFSLRVVFSLLWKLAVFEGLDPALAQDIMSAAIADFPALAGTPDEEASFREDMNFFVLSPLSMVRNAAYSFVGYAMVSFFSGLILRKDS